MLGRHRHLLAFVRRAAPRLERAGLALAAALAVACSSSAAPPSDATSAAPMFGQDDLPPGTRVEVARGSTYYPATIVQRLGPERFIVSYDGAGPQWNEAVGRERIRSPEDASTPALPRDYRPGENVLVKLQNRLLLADVLLQVGPQTWRVRYDGFGPAAVEDVSFDRLRRPYFGATAHAVGEPVIVEVNGQFVPARVLAASAPDRWLVRYDAYGPQYDQEIDQGRLRSAAPPPPAVASAPEPPAPAPAPPVEAPATPADGTKGGTAGPTADTPLKAGDAVLVGQRGSFFPATLTGAGAGRWKVRFESAAAGAVVAEGGEEEVAEGRVLRLVSPPRGGKLQPGQLVFIEWHGLYVPGKVLKEQDKGQYKIRFDGYGPESDEILPTRRLRLR